MWFFNNTPNQKVFAYSKVSCVNCQLSAVFLRRLGQPPFLGEFRGNPKPLRVIPILLLILEASKNSNFSLVFVNFAVLLFSHEIPLP
jgi:hypothetical protein